MSNIHDDFYVSMLQNLETSSSHVLEQDNHEFDADIIFEKEWYEL